MRLSGKDKWPLTYLVSALIALILGLKLLSTITAPVASVAPLSFATSTASLPVIPDTRPIIPVVPIAITSATTSPASAVTSTAPAASVEPAPPATSMPPPVTKPVPSASGAQAVGISVDGTLYAMSDQELGQEFADMESLGITWVRFDIGWDQIQPRKATAFTWSGVDRIVSEAKEHHLKLLGLLSYTPGWARSPDCSAGYICGPADPAAFGAFAHAAAERYGSDEIAAWEIWNEPNIGKFWGPEPDPQAYGLVLEAAYSGIKSADPAATVVSAGLSPAATEGDNIAPVAFLQALYAEGAGSSFDAVGFHPYSFPEPPSDPKPWNAWYQMSGTSPSLRSVMSENGDSGKEIWMTEYGAPTSGPDSDHVSEDVQAQMISQAVTLKRSYSWSGPIFIYSYKDLGTSTDTIENFFGILRNDGSEKPAYDALKQLLSTDN